jgi:O-methyltransferase
MDAKRAIVSNLGARVRTAMKRALRITPLPPLLLLEKACWGLRFNEWFRKNKCEEIPYFQKRFEMYGYLSEGRLNGVPIDYLEFGVANGDSIRHWMHLSTHPESRFFGFDTFEGLPEPWKHVGGSTPIGTFSANGQPPIVENESRVRFVKGLFQDTIPGFTQAFQPCNQLVLHMDADLYSSTLYVLASLNGLLGPGTIVLFDEFDSFDNEFRALDDFVSAFRKDYSVLACCGECYAQIAIQFRR